MSHANAIAFFALCSEAQTPGFGNGLALNFEGADRAPEWVQLMPRGPRLRGNDGRTWLLEEPQGLVEAFNARGLKRPIDINHAAFLKAPRGEEAPAAGWIEELAVRDGAIFARIGWTPKGREAVLNRDYRYISPSFNHDAKGNVVELLGAGLVNTPNFTLPALNSETRSMFKDLLKKLGLAETASENDAIAAVEALQTAQNAGRVDLNLYVPRADFQLALNRANEAETKLADQAKSARSAEVTALIDGAVKAGKIAPASKEFYVATCASEEGLAAFKKHVETLPKLFDPAKVEDRTDPANVALNAEQTDVALNMGIDPKAFATFVAEQKR
jgi:phage I-like protein